MVFLVVKETALGRDSVVRSRRSAQLRFAAGSGAGRGLTGRGKDQDDEARNGDRDLEQDRGTGLLLVETGGALVSG